MKLKLLAVTFFLCLPGCINLGKSDVDIPPRPRLSGEEKAIARYEETVRQAVVATDRLLEETEKELSTPESPEPPEPGEIVLQPVPDELDVAQMLVGSLRSTLGEPRHNVSMDTGDLEALAGKLKKRGKKAENAQGKIEKKWLEWANSVEGEAEGALASQSFWSTVKWVVLLILVVVGLAGFVFIRMQYGKLLSTIFAAIMGGAVILYILFFYMQYVILAGLAAAVLVIGYLIYAALREGNFARDLVRDIQNGRRALSREERQRWNKATSANMKKEHRKKIERLKKVSGVDPADPEEAEDG